MKLSPTKLVAFGWWSALVALGGCAVLVLLPGVRFDQGLPLFFWTLMGLLLVVATAGALGLPHDRAGPWRTLLIALYACAEFQHYSGENLFHRLLVLLPRAWRRFVAGFLQHAWDASVFEMLLYLAIAGAATAIALLLMRPEPSAKEEPLQFGMLHLFALSTFVALSCVALRYASPGVNGAALLALLGLRIAAAIGIGAGRGNRLFLVGFLFGSFAWEALIDHWQLTAEWSEWLPESLVQHRPGWPAAYQSLMLRAWLPLYAGLATGVLASLFCQRATSPDQNKQGDASASP